MQPPGSSPLARGTLYHVVRASAGAGLIPARAGNTPCWKTLRATSRAHPRSRGEHPLRPFREIRDEGSSPLARGTPLTHRGLSQRCGLIPARAGNTRPRPPKALLHGAHPRSRGEHESHLLDELNHPGSSPLARGTLPEWRGQAGGLGLIPARAGNTSELVMYAMNSWAHPRSRGEHQ